MFNNKGEADPDTAICILGIIVLFLMFFGAYFAGGYTSYNDEMNKLTSKNEQIITHNDKHYQIQVKEITTQGLKEIKENK